MALTSTSAVIAGPNLHLRNLIPLNPAQRVAGPATGCVFANVLLDLAQPQLDHLVVLLASAVATGLHLYQSHTPFGTKRLIEFNSFRLQAPSRKKQCEPPEYSSPRRVRNHISSPRRGHPSARTVESESLAITLSTSCYTDSS